MLQAAMRSAAVRNLAVCVLGAVLLAAGNVRAEEKEKKNENPIPAQVKSTAEVLQALKDDHKKAGFLGEPFIDSAETSQRDFKAFVAWHNPYSGQAATRVYIYRWEPKAKAWERKVSGEFDDTHDVSVEFGPHRVYIRDVQGKIVHRYPVE